MKKFSIFALAALSLAACNTAEEPAVEETTIEPAPEATAPVVEETAPVVVDSAAVVAPEAAPATEVPATEAPAEPQP